MNERNKKKERKRDNTRRTTMMNEKNQKTAEYIRKERQILEKIKNMTKKNYKKTERKLRRHNK